MKYSLQQSIYNQINLSMQLQEKIKNELESKFQIIKLLGKGAFGNVYQCIQNANKEKYAVKIISKINVKKSKIDSLKQQSLLLKSLNHENIVKIYEYGQFQNCVYIKMQIAFGGNLQNLINLKRRENQMFNDETVAKIMLQLFKGLSYIHSLSIIHRDIKPQNILLIKSEEFKNLKICDFGLSTKLDFHYPKSAIAKCGTLLFMAPEIICKYTYTKAVDIWSSAVLMYMLITGNHPIWNSQMTVEQFKVIMSSKIRFPEITNNKWAQDFIQRISKNDPNQRYTAQEALKHPWLTRQFSDQIPLSIHQSYSGFSISHQIVRAMKTILTIKMSLKGQLNKISHEYLIKLKQLNEKQRPQVSLKIRKLKSLNYEKQSFLSSLSISQHDKEVESPKKINKSRQIPESDVNNPTILKLNEIFNTLFDKKITSKSKVTYRQKDAPQEVHQEAPNIQIYKKRIELEIEQSVNAIMISNKKKNRRILPIKTTEKLAFQDKDEIIGKNANISNFRKSKYRKRINELIKSALN